MTGRMLGLLWTIQAAPFLAFLFIALGGRFTRRLAPAAGLAGAGAALAANLALFPHAFGNPAVEFRHLWIRLSDVVPAPLFGINPARLADITIGFLLDPLNLLMLSVVTAVSFFVQLFSVFYMADDGDKPRYFGFLSLFSFSMIGLVLSLNLLQTFMFWELVGLASYLLIGFWFEKSAASNAARKAFVLNRLADLGFLSALVVLLLCFGTMEISALTSENLNAALPAGLVTAIGLLVFMGVAGKSAQFPFHVWLPDAMEGPTPVSALIHSATMVAAGVFLLARVFGLFAASAATMGVILVVGTITALLSATVATVQRDIKRVLAYSTVSQLGLMVMGIAAGSMAAGVFHLVTHAFFKSLLFLTAGAFIHRFNTNDIVEMARHGARREKFLAAFLLVGVFSLCGVPPFGGFFSKDAILHQLKTHGIAAFACGLTVAFLTAFYSFRMVFVLLSRPHGESHAHGKSALLVFCERAPLAVLAVLSVIAGFLGTPFAGGLLLKGIAHEAGHAERFDAGLAVTVLGLTAAGAVLAFAAARKVSAGSAGSANPVETLLVRKYFLDDLYAFLVKKIGLRIAAALRWFDVTFVNGIMVNQTAFSTKRLGRVFSRIQNGIFQDYAFVAVAIAVGALAFLVFKGAS